MFLQSQLRIALGRDPDSEQEPNSSQEEKKGGFIDSSENITLNYVLQMTIGAQ